MTVEIVQYRQRKGKEIKAANVRTSFKIGNHTFSVASLWAWNILQVKAYVSIDSIKHKF